AIEHGAIVLVLRAGVLERGDLHGLAPLDAVVAAQHVVRVGAGDDHPDVSHAIVFDLGAPAHARGEGEIAPCVGLVVGDAAHDAGLVGVGGVRAHVRVGGAQPLV